MHGLFGSSLAWIVAVVAIAGQPLIASAGDFAPERYIFYLAAQPNRSIDNLCVGDIVRIDVTAERFIANKRATDTDRNTSPPVQLYGVSVNGAVGNRAPPRVKPCYPEEARRTTRKSRTFATRSAYSWSASLSPRCLSGLERPHLALY
jgi:hypothetical protein